MTIDCEQCGKVTHISMAHSKNIFYIPKVCSSACFVKLIIQPYIDGAGSVLSGYDVVLNYNDIDEGLRSNYERGFVEWLNLNNIKWMYEKYRFRLSDGSVYVPDFFLPVSRVFIEVKGLWINEGWKKFKLFSRDYGQYRSFLVDRSVMRNIGCRPKTLTEVLI